MLKSSYERFKKISQRISAIFEICECGVDEALADEITKQPAIMMHFINMYELFKGIQEKNDVEALSFFTSEDVGALSKTRNIASHEYEKINFSLIKAAIEDYLPKLQNNLKRGMEIYKESVKSADKINNNSSNQILDSLAKKYEIDNETTNKNNSQEQEENTLFTEDDDSGGGGSRSRQK